MVAAQNKSTRDFERAVNFSDKICLWLARTIIIFSRSIWTSNFRTVVCFSNISWNGWAICQPTLRKNVIKKLESFNRGVICQQIFTKKPIQWKLDLIKGEKKHKNKAFVKRHVACFPNSSCKYLPTIISVLKSCNKNCIKSSSSNTRCCYFTYFFKQKWLRSCLCNTRV